MLAIGILIDIPEDDPERRLAIIDDAGHEIGTRARILQAIIRESRQIRLEVRSAALPFAVDHGSVLSPRYGVLDTLAWPDRRIAPEADHRLTTETPSTNGGRGGNREQTLLFLLIFSLATYVRDAGVAGSNPATPTILPKVDVFQRLGRPAAGASGAPFCNDFRGGSTADLAGQGGLPG
ncbi:hypothetical protein UP06_13400 [Bradyrhizobium sp. LTSP857]|nr:hypothetical protein UP06_13400 [Bradyrhizobium sp. LTSP857]